MSAEIFQRGILCPPSVSNCSRIVDVLNDTEANAYKLMDQAPFAPRTEPTMLNLPRPFPTVDVPGHAHYAIAAVILAVGITGTLGNLLVIYAFCRSRGLRTPTNMFIINLAMSDFLMSVTQCPVFFINSLNKRWIFGGKGCELYAFCGALFGIASMITLTVIALDRYFVITRPLASIGVMSKKKALLILLGVWLYSLAWSLPPFFGWSAYVPEGLLTSCSWDYITFTPSVRAYTMLLFCFVFFIPLIAIIYSYMFIFRAIKNTNRAVQKLASDSSKESQRLFQRMKNEWKMAKIALIVILLYIISWTPYSVVALLGFSGYSHLLTPFMNTIPAVIAKASAIHNPIIYAIAHPKYRMAIAKVLPCLRPLLRVSHRDSRSLSYASTRRPTVTSQSSDINGLPRGTRRLSSISDSESDKGGGKRLSEAEGQTLSPSLKNMLRLSLPIPKAAALAQILRGICLLTTMGCMVQCSYLPMQVTHQDWTDTEADLSSLNSRGASGQVSYEMGEDTAEMNDSKVKSKLKSHDSGIFEKTSVDADEISMVEDLPFGSYIFQDSLTGEDLNHFGPRGESSYYSRSPAAQIPSIIVTFSNVQRTEPPSESNTDPSYSRNSGYSWEQNASSQLEWLYQGSAFAPASETNMCQLSVENLPKLL